MTYEQQIADIKLRFKFLSEDALNYLVVTINTMVADAYRRGQEDSKK